jgi:hypothetical protein
MGSTKLAETLESRRHMFGSNPSCQPSRGGGDCGGGSKRRAFAKVSGECAELWRLKSSEVSELPQGNLEHKKGDIM